MNILKASLNKNPLYLRSILCSYQSTIFSYLYCEEGIQETLSINFLSMKTIIFDTLIFFIFAMAGQCRGGWLKPNQTLLLTGNSNGNVLLLFDGAKYEYDARHPDLWWSLGI